METLLESALLDLGYLIKSDGKCRIGFTLSNGKSDKTDPMGAEYAKTWLMAQADVLGMFGIEYKSLTVYRFEV